MIFFFSAYAQKVRLKDVATITLHRDEFTTARRSQAIPQLKCVGGSAKAHAQPRVAVLHQHELLLS